MQKNQTTLLNLDELIKIISNNGIISKYLPNYEYREAQEAMMKNIINCFNNNNIGLIEAGTGTGKSLAYLIPSIMWAVINKEKVVISTNTINLQEQLINKDVPFLEKIFKTIDIKFISILVKGAGNYICKKKLMRSAGISQGIIDNEMDLKYLYEIIKLVNASSNKDKSKNYINEGTKLELDFIPSDSLWEKISVETDICSRNRCSYYNDCFFFKARKESLKADLLIVNHHLLCSDIAIRMETKNFTQNALLPAYTKIIIDEAHNIEDTATNYFGSIVTRIGLKRFINKLYHKNKNNESGYLLNIKNSLNINLDGNLVSEIKQIIDDKLIDKINNIILNIDKFFDLLFYYINKKLQNIDDTKLRLITENLQENNYKQIEKQGNRLCEIFSEIHTILYSLSTKLKKFHNKNKIETETETEIKDYIQEINAYITKIYSYSFIIKENISLESDNKVYWIEIKNKNNPRIIRLLSCPLDVSGLLEENIFKQFQTVILTSATLSTNKNFSYIKERIGLSNQEKTQLIESQIESPFNYELQSVICVPEDISSPQSNSYLKESSEYAKEIVKVTKSSTFLLFTSVYAMNYTYEYIKKNIKNENISLLKQGMYDRHTIITKFKNSNNSILFGLNSFWEGVDVSGDSLKCVVLMKLPFQVPTEPIIQARIEKMEKEKINPFINYSLPQTIIKFKQGFGRLIRSKNDKGCVICLDSRIINKSYGKIFLNSLPQTRTVIGKKRLILSEIKKYFI